MNLKLHKCAFLQPSDVSHQLGVKGNYLIDRQTINAVTAEGYLELKINFKLLIIFCKIELECLKLSGKVFVLSHKTMFVLLKYLYNVTAVCNIARQIL